MYICINYVYLVELDWQCMYVLMLYNDVSNMISNIIHWYLRCRMYV